MGIAETHTPGIVDKGDVMFLKGNVKHYTFRAVDDPKLVSVGTKVVKGKAIAALCLGFMEDGDSFNPGDALRAMGWTPTRGLDVEALLIRMTMMERALRAVVKTGDSRYAREALKALHPPKRRVYKRKKQKRLK